MQGREGGRPGGCKARRSQGREGRKTGRAQDQKGTRAGGRKGVYKVDVVALPFSAVCDLRRMRVAKILSESNVLLFRVMDINAQ